jgi:predicted dehydrogenase
MKTYRAAIIGTGGIAESHIRAIRAAGERVEMVAAMDVDEGRVKAFCEKHEIPRWYTDAGAMLDAAQADLVHIASPTGMHAEQVAQSLDAGAWVLCEKPLCGSLAEFDRISEAESRAGRYVSTVFQWRFGSAAKHVKKLIEAGELGELRVAVCDTLWYRGLPYYEVPWRGKWATETGGATVTLGIHLMDLFLWFNSEWEEICAMAATLDRPIETDNVSMAIARFKNGALASVSSSALSPRQESHLRMDFQRATVEVTALYRYMNENWRFSIPENSPDGEALARWQSIERDVMGTHNEQLAELLDAMDRGERPPVSGADSRRIVEFIASLYKAAFTGQPVARGSIGVGDPFYVGNRGNSDA